MTEPPQIILASQSRARQTMLRAVGLSFSAEVPQIDEETLQQKLIDSMVPPDLMATALAQAKAVSIGHHHPESFVIGADQVLYLGGKIFSKAKDRGEAAEKLRALSGKTHELVSAACVVHRGRTIWQHSDRARITMRQIDDLLLTRYCTAAPDALTRSVGAYELEGPGAWLLERAEGDYFTILGLPLLPLLHFLQGHGVGPW